jgi:hypothetical protein
MLSFYSIKEVIESRAQEAQVPAIGEKSENPPWAGNIAA